MAKFKITLARQCWQYMVVEVEAADKTEAVEKTKTPEFWASQDEGWTWPEPDDEVIFPEDPETNENVEVIE